MSNRITPIDLVSASPPQAAAIGRFLQHRRGVETSPANLYGMLFTSAGAGDALSELGAHCRFQNAVPRHELEAAILTTLYRLDFAYEVGPHETYARALGLGQATIDAIRDGRIDDLDARLSTACRVAATLVGGEPVPQELFDEAVTAWGSQGVVDLTVTVGYYALLALVGRMLTPELDRGGETVDDAGSSDPPP